MPIRIINESPSDTDRIHALTRRAFLSALHTDHTEQFIVDALRRAGALTLSLVAWRGGEMVGHVAVSPVVISSGASGWYGLGPISVLPEAQGLGIGSRLMNEALAALRASGASGCVLLGEPAYYGRFGFKVIEGLVLPGVPSEYFQAVSFAGGFPVGEVAYHEAFTAQA